MSGVKFSFKAKDFGWDKLIKAVRATAGRHDVSVGVFADGPARAGGEASNVTIALVHEFGSPAMNIPERSYLRSTVDKNRAKYHAEIKRIAAGVLDGKSDVQALNLLGMRGAADVKATIREGIDPPLKPETIARKGSSLPLVDTGQLINSITWKLTRRGP